LISKKLILIYPKYSTQTTAQRYTRKYFKKVCLYLYKKIEPMIALTVSRNSVEKFLNKVKNSTSIGAIDTGEFYRSPGGGFNCP